LWRAWTGSAGSVPSREALTDVALGDRVEFSIKPGGEGRDIDVFGLGSPVDPRTRRGAVGGEGGSVGRTAGRAHSSGIPALRRPAREVASRIARTFALGILNSATAFNRLMLL
jgi:hypothetical protein